MSHLNLAVSNIEHFLQKNKANPRKEFFRLSLADIRREVEGIGISNAHWTMTAEAAQYRETMKLDQEIKASPKLAEEWINQQMRFEPVVESEEEATV